MKQIIPPLLLFAAGLGFWWAGGSFNKPVSQTPDSIDPSQSATTTKPQDQTEGINAEDSQAVSAKFLGTWATDFGLMSLFDPPYSDGLNGFYYDSKTGEMEGIIWASYSDNTLTGYWIQSVSQKKCPDKKHGTYYWGRIKFVMNNNSFAGKWGYCGGLLDRDWNGVMG